MSQISLEMRQNKPHKVRCQKYVSDVQFDQLRGSTVCWILDQTTSFCSQLKTGVQLVCSSSFKSL